MERKHRDLRERIREIYDEILPSGLRWHPHAAKNSELLNIRIDEILAMGLDPEHVFRCIFTHFSSDKWWTHVTDHRYTHPKTFCRKSNWEHYFVCGERELKMREASAKPRREARPEKTMCWRDYRRLKEAEDG